LATDSSHAVPPAVDKICMYATERYTARIQRAISRSEDVVHASLFNGKTPAARGPTGWE
jgi:hypothetical protein